MEGLELFNPFNKLQAEPDSHSSTPPSFDYSDDDDDDDDEEEMDSVTCDESDGSEDMDCDGEEEYTIPTTKQKKTDLTLRIGKMRNGNELAVSPRDNSGSNGGSNGSSNGSSNGGSNGGSNGSSNGGGSTGALPTSFQVEKQQGLKMTFRKSGRQRSTAVVKDNEAQTMQVSAVQ